MFNTHFYDQKALSGVFMWGKAKDGQYSADFGTVRERAAALGTRRDRQRVRQPVTGYTSDKTPTVLKAMYQALDSRRRRRGLVGSARRSGSVLSATQWQWDIYNGRHHELMNGNPDKSRPPRTPGTARTSRVVQLDDAGTAAAARGPAGARPGLPGGGGR